MYSNTWKYDPWRSKWQLVQCVSSADIYLNSVMEGHLEKLVCKGGGEEVGKLLLYFINSLFYLTCCCLLKTRQYHM